jgi:hypothetical protein
MMLLLLFVESNRIHAQDSPAVSPHLQSLIDRGMDPRISRKPADVLPRVHEVSYRDRPAQVEAVPVSAMIGGHPALVYPNISLRPSSTTTQSEMSVAVHPTNPNVVLAGSNAVHTSISVLSQGWYYTTNAGVSWAGRDTFPTHTNLSSFLADPATAINLDGNLYFSALRSDIVTDLFVARSTNQGISWSSVNLLDPGSGEDKNHLVIDTDPSSPLQGYVYVGYTDFEASPSPIKFARSSNGGSLFTTPAPISGNIGGLFAQGINLAVGPAGVLYAAWSGYDSWPPPVNTRIGFARSTDGGATWSAARAVDTIQDIRGNLSKGGNLVRVSSFPSMAVDRSSGPRRGWIYLVFPERTALGPDIFVKRSTDGGNSWSSPRKVNQDATGRDSYYPWCSVDPLTGFLHVAYYDSRDFTANDSAVVFMSTSVDGGETFDDVRVSDTPFLPRAIAGLATGYGGDYIGIAALNGIVWPCWNDTRTGIQQAYAARIVFLQAGSPPTISLSSDTIDFGTQMLGYPDTLDFYVRNIGFPGTLSITSIHSSGGQFIADQSAFTLPGGSSRRVRVRCAASMAGPQNAILTIESNDSSHPAVSIRLLANVIHPPIVRVTPDSVSFVVNQWDSATSVLAISNRGSGYLHFNVSHSYTRNQSASSGGTQQEPLLRAATEVAELSVLEQAGPEQRPIPVVRNQADYTERLSRYYGESALHGLPSIGVAGGFSSSAMLLLLSDAELVTKYAFVDIGNGFTLPMLQAHEGIIVSESDYGLMAVESDALRDYMDAGYPVLFAMDDLDNEPAGVLTDMLSSFGLVAVTDGDFVFEALNTSHPVADGISTVESLGSDNDNYALDDAAWIVEGADNKYYMTAREIGSHRVMCGEAFDAWWNASPSLMRNAVNWTLSGGGWLSENPTTGVVGAGASVDISLKVRTGDLSEGSYNATMQISTNDPADPVTNVPLRMRAVSVPHGVLSTDTLDFHEEFVGYAKTLHVTIRNIGSDTLRIHQFQLTNAMFSVSAGAPLTIDPRKETTIPIRYLPTASGQSSGLIRIRNNSPGDSVMNLVVLGMGIHPPVAGVAPDSISYLVEEGDSSTKLVTVTNSGLGPLNFEIKNVSGNGTMSATNTAGLERMVNAARNLADFIKMKGPAFDFGSSASDDSLAGYRRLVSLYHEAATSLDLPAIAVGGSYTYYTMPILLGDAEMVSKYTFVGIFDGYTLPILQGYHGVIISEHASYAFNADESNALVEYANLGYPVLFTMEDLYDTPADVQTNLLNSFGLLTGTEGDFDFGAINVSHPIASGISSMDLQWYGMTKFAPDDAEWVVAGTDGKYYVTARNIGGHRLMFGSTFGVWWSASPQFMRNAITWAMGDGEWLSVDPASGVIGSGGSINIAVKASATDLDGGTYRRALQIACNDPERPLIRIPVGLRVTGVPNLALKTDTLDYGESFIGYPDTLGLQILNDGTDSLRLTGFQSTNARFAVLAAVPLAIGPRKVMTIPVLFRPTAAGDANGIVRIRSNDPEDSVVSVVVKGRGVYPPVIGVTPDSLSFVLNEGDSSAFAIAVNNSGLGLLHYDISHSYLPTERSAGSSTSQSRMLAAASRVAELFTWETSADETGRTATVKDTAELAERLNRYYEASRLMGLPSIGITGAYSYDALSVLMSDTAMLSGYTFVEVGNEFTLPMLLVHQGIIVSESDAGLTVTESNALRDYMQSGFPVLFAMDDLDDESTGIQTDMLNSFGLLNTIDGDFIFGSLNASHPIASGVTGMYSLSSENNSFTLQDADWVVAGTDTKYYVTACQSGSRRVMCGEGFDQWWYSSPELMRNAIHWAFGRGGWLSENPTTGVVTAGGSTSIAVKARTVNLNGGPYEAMVKIKSDDPVRPETNMPVHLYVIGMPEVALLDDSIDFHDVFIGYPETLAVRIVNEGSDSLRIGEFQSTNARFRALGGVPLVIGPRVTVSVPLLFLPKEVGVTTGQIRIRSNDPADSVVNLEVRGRGIHLPEITIAPDSLSFVINRGDSASSLLEIRNTGLGALHVTIEHSYSHGDDLAIRMALRERVITSAQMVARLVRREASSTEDRLSATVSNPEEFALRLGEYYRISEILGLPKIGVAGANWNDVMSLLLFDTAMVLRYEFVDVGNDFTLPMLLSYEGIIVGEYDFGLTLTESDAMRDYMNSGFPVLFAMDDLDDEPMDVRTEMLNSFGLLNTTDGDFWFGTFNVSHPIAYELEVMNSLGSENNSFTLNTAEWVVAGADGKYYVTALDMGSRRVMCGEGFSEWWHASPQLMRNAINWAFERCGWISENPRTGVLGAGRSLNVAINIKTGSLDGGTYHATLQAKSDDPVRPLENIPVRLRIIGVPNLALLTDTLNFGEVFFGFPETLSVRIENNGSDSLRISRIIPTNDEFEVLAALPLAIGPSRIAAIPLRFLPAVSGGSSGLMRVFSNDPEDSVITLVVTGEGVHAPAIGVTPDSMLFVLSEGDSTASVFTISNGGLGPLIFEIDNTYTVAGVSVINRPQDGTGMNSVNTGDRHGEKAAQSALPSVGLAGAYSSSMMSFLQVDSILTSRYTFVNVGNDYTLARLQAHDAIIVSESTAGLTAMESDALREYMAQGSPVVLAMNALNDEPIGIKTDMLNCFGLISASDGSFTFGQVNTFHPIAHSVSVTNWTSTYNSSFIPVDAEWIVAGTDGTYHMTARDGGSRRVMCGGLLSEWWNANRQLVRNTIDWTIGGIGWLSESPTTGVVGPDESAIIALKVETGTLDGGTHRGAIRIRSNDPGYTAISVPVSMTIVGKPAIVFLNDSLDFGDVFIDHPETLSVQITNVGSDSLRLSQFVSTNSRFEVITESPLAIGPRRTTDVEVRFVPTDATEESGLVFIRSNDAVDSVIHVVVAGRGFHAPAMTIAPDSLSFLLNEGDSTATSLTIRNSGLGILHFDLDNLYTPGGTSPTDAVQREQVLLAARRAAELITWSQSGTGEPEMASVSDPEEFEKRLTQYYSASSLLNLPSVGVVGYNSNDAMSLLLSDSEMVVNYTFMKLGLPYSLPAFLAHEGVIVAEQVHSFSEVASSVLVDYMHAGFPVVFAMDDLDNAPNDLQAVVLSSFGLLTTMDGEFRGGTVNTSHPIADGISSLGYAGYGVNSFTLNDAEWIALGKDGLYYVTAREIGSRRVMNGGMFTTWWYSSPRLMKNEIEWAMKGSKWLSEYPVSGDVIPGGSANVTLRAKTADLNGGSSSITVQIRSNDPLHEVAHVPVRLTVIEMPNLVLTSDTLDFDKVFLAFPETLGLRIQNNGSDSLLISQIQSTNPLFEVVANIPITIGPHKTVTLPVRFAPAVVGEAAGLIRIQSNDPGDSVVSLVVIGSGVLPPVMSVLPESLSIAVSEGDSMISVLRINNSGLGPLEYSTGHAYGGMSNPGAQELAWLIEAARNVAELGTWEGTGSGRRLIAIAGDTSEAKERLSRYYSISSSLGLPSIGLAGGWSNSAMYKLLYDSTMVSKYAFVDLGDDFTLEMLEGQHGIIVSEYDYGLTATESDALREYMISGSSVILAMDNLDNEPAGVRTDMLNSFGLLAATDGSFYFGALNASHQLTQGVAGLNAYGQHGNNFTLGDAEWIVAGTDGKYYVTARETGSHRVMFGRPFDDWWYASQELMRNAVDWTMGGSGWLSEEPSGGVVNPGEVTTIDVKITTAELDGGSYLGTVRITGNDPVNPVTYVPTTLRVIGVPSIVVEPDSIFFGEHFVGSADTVQLRIGNNGSRDLRISALSFDDPTFVVVDSGQFAILPRGDHTVRLACAPNDVGLKLSMLSIRSNDPTDSLVRIPATVLSVHPPDISVRPDSLGFGINRGDSGTTTFAVRNPGLGVLEYFVENHGLYGRSAPPRIAYTLQLRVANNAGASTLVRFGIHPDATYGVDGALGEYDAYSPPVAGAFEARWLDLPGRSSMGFGLLDKDLRASITPTQIDTYLVKIQPGAGGYPLRISWPAGMASLVSLAHLLNAGGDPPLDVNMLTTTSAVIVDAQIDSLYIVTIGTGGNWLTYTPSSGTLAAGDSNIITLSAQTAAFEPGSYMTVLAVMSNDPESPLTRVPVTLRVRGTPEIVLESDTLDFGVGCIGFNDTLWLRVGSEGTDTVVVTGITSDTPIFGPAFYGSVAISPGSIKAIPVYFSPTSQTSFSGTLSLASNDTSDPVMTVAAMGTGILAPELRVSPDSLELTVMEGDSTAAMLHVKNLGPGALHFSAMERSPADINAVVPEQAADMAQLKDALVIQDVNPWSTIALFGVLNNHHITYDRIRSDAIAAKDLGRYPLIIIPGDQPTTFYTTVAANMQKFNTYVTSGGVLEFHASGWGQHGGDASGIVLPGGVLVHPMPCAQNAVVEPRHLLARGVPPTITGTVVSTSYFSSLPSMATVVARNCGGLPTLAEYPFGDGHVVATGQAVEYGYFYSEALGVVLGNLMTFSLSRSDLPWLDLDPHSGIIDAGDSLQILVRAFSGSLDGGIFETHICFENDDPRNIHFGVPLRLSVIPAPEMLVGLDSLDFGDVYLKNPDTLALPVQNAGSDSLRITSVPSSSSEFMTTTLLPFVIAPYKSGELRIRFRPSALASYAESLLIHSNDPHDSTHKVFVKGSGQNRPIIAWDVDSLFLSVIGSGSVSQAMTLRNEGMDTLNAGMGTSYPWLRTMPGFVRLDPGESTQVEIVASGGTLLVGNHRGIINVTTNDPVVPWFGVPVHLTVEYPGMVVAGSWNLLSIPLVMSEYRTSVLFPEAVSAAYGFDRGYKALDSLRNGVGYWMKFNQPGLVALSGLGYDRDTVEVRSGWNLIGALSCAAPVIDIDPIPPVAIVSSFVEYDSVLGYVNADTLWPTRGYWVKANVPGRLIVSGSSSGLRSAQYPLDAKVPLPSAVMSPGVSGIDNLSELRFRSAAGGERSLYYSSQSNNVDVSLFELPPPPPAGLFDVRFASQKNIEVAESSVSYTEYPLDIQGASYPLNITWDTERMDRSSSLQILCDDGSWLRYPLVDTGSCQISSYGPVVLHVVSPGDHRKPSAFALDQNYPNPFNPLTTISYAVSTLARVRVVVYNLLGQEVVVLVNDIEEAGYKRVVWRGVDARNAAVPSGVYFCRMTAQEITTGASLHTSVRKMAVVK